MNHEKRSRRLIRVTATVLFALLWAVIVALALELYAASKWWAIQRLNRYVQASQVCPTLWGMVDLDEDGRLLLGQLFERASQEPMMPPAESPPNDHVGTLFASLNERDRALFAELQESVVVAFGLDSRILNVYGRKQDLARLGIVPDNVKGHTWNETPAGKDAPELTEVTRKVCGGADPEAASCTLNGVTSKFSCFPMKKSDGTPAGAVCCLTDISERSLADVMAETPGLEEQPQWKIPLLEYRKNYRKDGPDWFTNNMGFWDDDIVLPKPANAFRIVCVGGSTTEEGPSVHSLSYPNILERKLNEYFGGNPRIDVINAGVVGLDSRGERKRMLDYIRLEPDLIVEYNIVNDLCHWLLPKWSENMSISARVLRHSKFVNAHCNALLWPNDRILSERIREATLRNLHIMHAVAVEKNVQMAICSFACPKPEDLKPEEFDYLEYQTRTFWQGKYYGFAMYRRLVCLYNDAVKSMCEKEGIMYVPVAEAYRGNLTCFSDICHMRPKGIEEKADIIFKSLRPVIEAGFRQGLP